jgi:hypothetical protein
VCHCCTRRGLAGLGCEAPLHNAPCARGLTRGFGVAGAAGREGHRRAVLLACSFPWPPQAALFGRASTLTLCAASGTLRRCKGW